MAVACNGYADHGAFGFFIKYNWLIHEMVCYGVAGITINKVTKIPEINHAIGFEFWNAMFKVECDGDFPAAVAANPGGDEEAEFLFTAQ